MIEVSNLTFEYPGVRALDDVSFSVQAGEITALVGPNGAGKTTLLRCLAALDQPITGSITVDGIDVLDNPRGCHRKVGYLADFFGLYQELSVRQCLTYMARAHHIQRVHEQDAIQRAAQRLQIDDRLDQKVGTLSRGLSQRLAISQAIVHEPAVLLLDEPASGLDPEARRSLSELFLELKAQGMTLMVSSHILAELEEYCTDMIIVRDGRITVQQDLRRPEEHTAVIMLVTSQPVESLGSMLASTEGISEVKADATSATFRFSDQPKQQQQLLKTLMDKHIPVCSFAEVKLNMQDTYLQQVAKMDQGNNA